MAIFDNIEFRAFDYDGVKDSLFDIARGEFDNWTDVLESNEGVMFIEWLAFMMANLAYLQNFHAKQAFLPTVTEAKNLAKLAKQFDYSIPNNEAALVDVTIFSEDDEPFINDVIIPEGTQLQTSGTEALIFETTEDLFIPEGSTSGDVPARNWESKTESNTSDGSQDQRITLSYSPYVEDTVVVQVDGVTWTEVDNFLDSDTNSEHYRIEVDTDGIVTVVFGDGTNGKIPTTDATLDFAYKVGGGAAGNVLPNSITVIPGTFYDVTSTAVSLAVTNDEAADGGSDREELEVSKLKIPKSIAAKEITIAKSDFETNITNVSGVARAQILTVNENEDIPENTIYAYVLPTASDTLSEALETEIELALGEDANPRPLTQSLYLIGPSFVTIPIEVRDLEYEPEDEDGTGSFAAATIQITNNTFDAGDTVTINGVDFTTITDWLPGISIELSAISLADAINLSTDPLLQDIEAVADDDTVTIRARTTGEHGNDYTLAETDGATNNFTLSGSQFQGGEDSTVQAAVRAAVDDWFGRTNIDEEGEYTVGFGQTVFLNRIIWLIQDVNGVKSFNLETPSADTELDAGEFPKYTLKFTTS